MLLKIIAIAFCALAPVNAAPQLGFLNSLASEALGFGQSVISDINPNTQPPQPLPTPSSAPAIVTSAVPSPSPTPQPQTSARVSSAPSTSQVTSVTPSPSPSPSPSLSPTPSSSVISTSSSTVSSPTLSSHSITSSHSPTISHQTSAQTSSTFSSSSSSTSTSTSSSTPAAISPAKSSSQTSHSNAPAIAAGIILGILGLVTILGLIWFFIRRRNKRLSGELDEQKDDTRSWNSKALDDDENPSARYDVPVPSNAMVQRPLPALVTQRKYLPYRPQQYQQSPVSPLRKTEFSLSNSSSSEVSEIDGRAVEMAPVELEGSMPLIKAEPSAEKGTSQTSAQAMTDIRTVKSSSAQQQAESKETNPKMGKVDDEDVVDEIRLARKPLVVRNV